MLSAFGLGSSPGLVDICTSDVVGICTGSITDTSDVSQLLQYLDGGLDPSTTTVGDWLTDTDLTGTSTPIADADLGSCWAFRQANSADPGTSTWIA